MHNVNKPENVTVCMIGFTIPKDEEKEKFNQKIKEFELDKIYFIDLNEKSNKNFFGITELTNVWAILINLLYKYNHII